MSSEREHAGCLPVLALDFGTGSNKAALYAADGTRLALARTEPGNWLEATARLRAELGPHAAIGLSTQTPTLVFCDESGRSLCDPIPWHDTRAGGEAGELLATPEQTRREWFGFDLPVGAASTPAKLLWMKRNLPDVWSQTRWVMQPKDYVAFHLTGQASTDHWCAKGIAHFETARPWLDRDVCPPLRFPYEANGCTTGGVPVSVGWSDALAGILALGAWHQPRAFVLAGTSEIVGASGRGYARAPGLFHVPASVLNLAGLELHYGPTEAGGASLEWLARIAGRTPECLLSLVKPGPCPILFRPYLNGERAPYWDHTLTAAFTGLRTEHGLADMAAAVLQGVALHERLVLETAGAGEPVALAGGAARNPVWNQIRADVLQRPLLVAQDPETSLRGAALLAWELLEPGILRDPPGGWFSADPVQPDGSAAGYYAEMMKAFRL